MRTLLDSYFYSVLYYNAQVWLTPDLNANLRQQLLSVLANALRSCIINNANEISFINIHKINRKSTPDQIMLYQISLELHKNLNNFFLNPSTQIAGTVNQIVCTGIQNYFEFYRTNWTKIGLNAIENKFYHIKKESPLTQLT